jgi:hypothetical protein
MIVAATSVLHQRFGTAMGEKLLKIMSSIIPLASRVRTVASQRVSTKTSDEKDTTFVGIVIREPLVREN